MYPPARQPHPRALRLAAFPLQAALEELDFSPERGLDRARCWNWGQCAWIGSISIFWSWVQLVGKNFPGLLLGTAAIGWVIRFATSAPRACSMPWSRPARTPRFSLLRSLARTDLLILDDWMRDALTSQAQDFWKS